jgi:predicted ATPase/DNA-binding SARP family transcriptional activator
LPAVRFGVLGPLEVSVSGQRIDLSANQLRRLLCLLLIAPGRPVPTSTVVECMWPTDVLDRAAAPKDARKTLRIYASRLRQQLTEEVGPIWDVRGYRLEMQMDDLDATRFEAQLAQASQLSGKSPQQSAEILRSALGLWRGPALDDCRDERWAMAAAARLEEMKRKALERLVDARLACGEHAALCGELEALVREHPLQERFWAQQMLALYRSGRQADALRSYQRLRHLLLEEIGIAPSAELAALDAAVLRQDPSLDFAVLADDVSGAAADQGKERPGGTATSTPPRSNLPVSLTSFVGRERELADLRELTSNARLVTLVGAGGVGKTRLAIQAATEMAGAVDGKCLVDLATLRDGDEVPRSIASALRVTPPAGVNALEAVVRGVGTDNVLLVLDNCEHLAAACASACRVLLHGCPGLAVMATSRQPLEIEGEGLYRVPPLRVASEAAAFADVALEDATRLFVDRARGEAPSFRLDESNSEIVSSLCRQLDGIPLALELAPARLRTLSVREVHDLLGERFRLLRDRRHSAPAHHETLAALFDWSYDVLGDDEKQLLRRLAVFSGGFDLDEVREVLCLGDADRWDLLDGITSLVEKSLLIADTSGDSARYRFLETVREYALSKLMQREGPGTLEDLRGRHAMAFARCERGRSLADDAAVALAREK